MPGRVYPRQAFPRQKAWQAWGPYLLGNTLAETHGIQGRMLCSALRAAMSADHPAGPWPGII